MAEIFGRRSRRYRTVQRHPDIAESSYKSRQEISGSLAISLSERRPETDVNAFTASHFFNLG